MRFLPFLSITLAFAIPHAPLSAGTGSQTGQRMEKEIGGQQLGYWLYLPEGADTAEKASIPLILFLHGAGERGDDLNRVKVHGPPNLVGKDSPIDGAIVVSPQCPEGIWWQVDTLKALLDEVLAAHPEADANRLYITGLSMGGYGTWGMLAEYPDLFAAAVPICGGGDITRLPKLSTSKPRIPFALEKLHRAKGVPVWAFHGDVDGVVPVGESRLVVDALKKAGAESVELTIYEGVNHDSWSRTYANPEVWKWLLEQKKD